MWVYLPTTVDDYSAMQWPAPDGFHIPLNTERQAVYNVWTVLGGWSSDWTNFWIALKLPFAGDRDYSTSNIDNQGSLGFYWSSPGSSANNAYRLYFGPSWVYPQNNGPRAYGVSVRCFKNEPINPISSWEVLNRWRGWLYHTSWQWYWIAHNSSEGLISISSNWTDWITIADKNLWATTVWNSWDTLSEANCGKYYQRWNNYWFPRTWSVTTSSTQVDASNYWPWNYYNSSTFITGANRSSVRNDNLWWWETWVVPKIAQTELKNAYIGEYVEPIYEYSYTFKWKTAAEIWNEFTLQTWVINTNANWVTWSSSQDCRITKALPSLATAERIIISWTVVCENNTRIATSIWIWIWSWWGNELTAFNIYGTQYNWIRVLLYTDWQNNPWNLVWYASEWTYNPVITIDLVNKVITWELSWFDNSTLTLTDARISAIRQYTYLVPYISLNYATISDISITIY